MKHFSSTLSKLIIIFVLLNLPIYSQTYLSKYAYWTEWISEEQGSIIAKPGYYLAGYRCAGEYCDRRQLYFVSLVNFDRSPNASGAQRWSTPVSEESPADKYIVPNGYLIAGLNCSGDYCDNIKFMIAQNRGANLAVDRRRQFWTHWISDESAWNEYIAPSGYFIVGYECRGDYCDDRRFLVAPLSGVEFNQISFSKIRSAGLNADVINGSANTLNQIPEGTIVLYKTNEGRYGKFLVTRYGYDLTISWCTYNASGEIYSQGDGLVIRGNYLVDLDLGKEQRTGSDLFWLHATGIDRYLVPQNGAKFQILQNMTLSFDLRLTFHYAPVHYQDVDNSHKEADFITRVDYDNNWSTGDNWDNLNQGDLSAHVYYSVVESKARWFIIYAFYHPRDWDDDWWRGEHENDFEGFLAIVKKSPTAEYGELEGIVTVYHENFFSYVPKNSHLRDGNSKIAGFIEFENVNGINRPKTSQESQGHGLKAYPFAGDFHGNDENSNRDFIKYYPSLFYAEIPKSNRDLLHRLLSFLTFFYAKVLKNFVNRVFTCEL